MKIRLQLVCESAPLADGIVQVSGHEYATDRDGFVDLDVVEGQHQIVVRHEDRVLKRNLVVDGKQTHTIIDVTPRSTLEVVVEKLLGDRYKLKSILGRGGMGVVFKAEDRVLNRIVAIKMLSGELESNEEAQRVFLEEARSLAPLIHPNLVAIHDILSVDAHTFMVLEYIIGSNLDAVLKQGPLDELTALRYMIQVTRAVSFMHSKGFIHRDIKPGNIVVQADGTLKMVDFGLARALEKLDAKGTSLRGTPAYMSPEQITGQVMSPKVDVYQIGITLYELLSGDLPFKGDMMYAHVHRDPELLSDQNVNVSLDISNLVARCMAKDPDMRPTSDELMRQFQELYLHGEDIDESEISEVLYERITRSTSTGNLPRVTRDTGQPIRRDKLPYILIGILFLMGLLAVGALVVFERTPATEAANEIVREVDEPLDEEPTKLAEKPKNEEAPTQDTEEVATVDSEPVGEPPVVEPVVAEPVVDERPKTVVRKKVVRKKVVKKAQPKEPEPEQVEEPVAEPEKAAEKPPEKKKKKSTDEEIMIGNDRDDDILLEQKKESTSDDILLQ